MWLLEWTLIQSNQCPYEKRKFKHRYIQREDHVKTQGEESHLQAKDRSLRRNQPWQYLDSTIYSLYNCEKINFCFLNNKKKFRFLTPIFDAVYIQNFSVILLL